MIVENVISRSISPENFFGAEGSGGMAMTGTGAHAARYLGLCKRSPSIDLEPGSTTTIAEIQGPGVIKSFWMTTWYEISDRLLLRIYWDGEETPSVEVPLSHFFCDGWAKHARVESEMILLLPKNGYNCYWEMPFRHSAKITLENLSNDRPSLYYQVNYNLKDIVEEEAYFHASWRRAKPLGDPALFTIVDGIQGPGAYVGTYLAMRPNAPGWPGEGEIKFYMDGDDKFPTICGTGTEDYFGGAWNFDTRKFQTDRGGYKAYTTPYLGFRAWPKKKIYKPRQKIGCYRWHIKDPIYFHDELKKVEIQVIAAGDAYVPLVNADISAMAVWYQMAPNVSPQRSLVDRASDLGYVDLASYVKV